LATLSNPRPTSEPLNSPLNWYVLRVKPRHEKAVQVLLQLKGYTVFLPFVTNRHRYTDRERSFDVPLFPGYVFAYFDAYKRLPLLKTPGVQSVLGIGLAPTPVDEIEIESLQHAVANGLVLEPLPSFEIGDRVRIEDGPLTGMQGIVKSVHGSVRIVLSVTLLQRSVLAHVETRWLCRDTPPRRLRVTGGAE
jgi:transcription termination/antitermination protein NusG